MFLCDLQITTENKPYRWKNNRIVDLIEKNDGSIKVPAKKSIAILF
jgi:hypothetical protein